MKSNDIDTATDPLWSHFTALHKVIGSSIKLEDSELSSDLEAKHRQAHETLVQLRSRIEHHRDVANKILGSNIEFSTEIFNRYRLRAVSTSVPAIVIGDQDSQPIIANSTNTTQKLEDFDKIKKLSDCLPSMKGLQDFIEPSQDTAVIEEEFPPSDATERYRFNNDLPPDPEDKSYVIEPSSRVKRSLWPIMHSLQ